MQSLEICHSNLTLFDEIFQAHHLGIVPFLIICMDLIMSMEKEEGVCDDCEKK
jgi:hypothetical protein